MRIEAVTVDFHELQRRNRRNTWLLLAGSWFVLALVGLSVAFGFGYGLIGGVIAAVAALAVTSIAYFTSSRVALTATRATPADPSEHRQLHNLVEGLSIASGVPKPDVYVVNDPAPNAFATGRRPEDGTVAVTTGLLDKMDRRELEGVLAHEIAHIRNHDIRVMTVAVATAGAIALLADVFWRALWWGGINGGRRRSNRGGGGGNALVLVGFVVVIVLAPIAAALLRAAISRRRESLADASAVEITRNPSGLRQALEKLEADVTVVRHTSHATSHLWIESPDDLEKGHKGSRLNGLFNTHPPLADRIEVLRRMEGIGPRERPARPEPVPPGVAPARTGWGGMGAALVDTAPASTPAGWYDDPLGEGALRWWDGTSWTAQISGPLDET